MSGNFLAEIGLRSCELTSYARNRWLNSSILHAGRLLKSGITPIPSGSIFLISQPFHASNHRHIISPNFESTESLYFDARPVCPVLRENNERDVMRHQ